MSSKISVIVWNEFLHEQRNEGVKALYPQGMHATIAEALRQTGVAGHLPHANATLEVSTATLEEPEHGLSEARLAACDVLIWWGHMAHDRVDDEVVARVHKRVLEGMGLIVLHSGHFSKIFRKVLGTNCSLKWREADEKERLWVVEPSHPIAAGLGEYFELPYEEMYGERFDIPQPDELVFLSWFEGGEVFRSGCCWQRGHGRIFYFRPGHEAYPTYHDANVQRVLANAVRWAAPRVQIVDTCPNAQPLEKIAPKEGNFVKVGVTQTRKDIE
jgi:trehalose utilization protein